MYNVSITAVLRVLGVLKVPEVLVLKVPEVLVLKVPEVLLPEVLVLKDSDVPL